MQTHRRNALNHRSKNRLSSVQVSIRNRSIYKVIFLIIMFQVGCSAKVPAPQILYDANIIIKHEIHLGNIIGGIRNIQKGDFSVLEGDEIAVVGQASYYLLSSKDYNVLQYNEYLDSNKKLIYLGLSPRLLDIDNDYVLEMMSGGGGFGEVGLFDSSGIRKWQFKANSESPPRKMISTLSAQNVSFYVADYTGLYKLDYDGNVIWHFGSESYLDVSQLTSGVVVGLNEYSELVFFTEDGEFQKKINLADKTNNFQIIKWPSEENILIESEGTIKILNLQGGLLFHYKIDSFPLYHAPQGISVRFEKNQKPYLVLLLHSRSFFGVSQLSIFQPDGQLIYQEILESTTGIAVNSKTITERETLLVGRGQSGIIEIEFNPQNNSNN